MLKIIDRLNLLDNKIIEILEKIILNISKERKEFYNQLKYKLEDYSEKQLLELLEYNNSTIDPITKLLLKDRFTYLKYKYEKILPFLNIQLDNENIDGYSYTQIDKATIVLNQNQIYHLANYFKLPIEITLETIIVYGIGNILNRDVDLDIINESKKIFIKNAKHTILYRLDKEEQSWETGIEFMHDVSMKYMESVYELFKYYSLGCYTLHYRNLVWCCISV